MKEVVQNKDIYRTATFLKQVLLHSNKFFRTDTFSTKALFQKRYFFTRRYNTQYNYCIIISLVFYLCLSEQPLFEKRSNIQQFFREAIFCITYSVWRASFSEWVRPNSPQQVLFQKSYFSKHTFLEGVLFHSYVPFLQLTSYLPDSN